MYVYKIWWKWCKFVQIWYSTISSVFSYRFVCKTFCNVLDLDEAEALYRIHSQMYTFMLIIQIWSQIIYFIKEQNNKTIYRIWKGCVSVRYLTFWVLRLLDTKLEFGNGVEALPEMWLYSERVPGLSQNLEQLVIGQEVESGTMTETLNKL